MSARLGSSRTYTGHYLVGDSVWNVKFVRQIEEGESVLGLCDPSTKTIYIRLRQKPLEIFKTFVHEILHAIEFEYNIELKHKIINPLEIYFSHFLAENALALQQILFGGKPPQLRSKRPKSKKKK